MRETDVRFVFAARLRGSRREKRWTRPDLERETGIPANTIRMYEDARSLPSAPRLVVLAQALDVKAEWLVPMEKEGEK
jgi:transcriptional regulator with XRE-family HTH domain